MEHTDRQLQPRDGRGRGRARRIGQAHLCLIGAVCFAFLTACGIADGNRQPGSPHLASATSRGSTSRATETGAVEWSAPGAGVLFYRGRGYRLQPPVSSSTGPLQTDRAIGTTALRWQTGGAVPPGTAIYSVAGIPTDRMLALKSGTQPLFFQEDQQLTALFESTLVVLGIVKSVGPPRCAWAGCLDAPPGQRAIGSVSTPATIAVDAVLHGRPVAETGEIEIRQMGAPDEPLPNARPVPLTVGSTVILFLQPGRLLALGDFGYGDFYWIAPAGIYAVEAGQVALLDAGQRGDPPVTREQFMAALAETFQGVRPRTPATPPGTPLAVPTATEGRPGPVPTTTLPVATPRP